MTQHPVRFDVQLSSATTDVRFDRPKTIDVNGTEVSSEQFQQGFSNQIGNAGFAGGFAGESQGDILKMGADILRFGVGVAKMIGQEINAIGSVFPGAAVPIGGAGPQTAALFEQSKRAKELRTPEEQEEIEQQAARGLALLGAVGFDVGLLAWKFAARPLLATIGRGEATGAMYGLLSNTLAPPHDGESMVTAIAKDMALFAGGNLAIGTMFGGRAFFEATTEVQARALKELARIRPPTDDLRAAMTEHAAEQFAREGGIEAYLGLYPHKDIILGSAGRTAKVSLEETRGAAQAVSREFFGETRVGRLQVKATTDAIDGPMTGFGDTPQAALDNVGQRSGAYAEGGINQQLNLLRSEGGHLGAGPPVVPPSLVGNISIAETPRDIWLYGKYLAPIHTWGKRWPAAAKIYESARARRLIQDQTVAEWRDLTTRTRKTLPKKEDRVRLGDLLDDYVRGEDLPASLDPALIKVFGEWRARLDVDRAALQGVLGASPDWGIDAYFMHVFVGDWQVVNAATGATMQLAKEAGFKPTFREAMDFAQRLLKQTPDANIQVMPKSMTWQTDSALELSGKAYNTLLTRTQQTLSISRDEAGEILKGLTQPKGRFKSFGHALQRERNLEGFVLDPTDAAEIYSHGLARKLAFHDFEKQSLKILDDLKVKAETPGVYDSLQDYVARVLGRPSNFERGWNSMVEWAFGPQGPARQLPFGPQAFRLRALSSRGRRIESIWRLGYSGAGSFVNMSQTVVNTASLVGYRDTLAATGLLKSASPFGKRATPELAVEIDKILVDAGVEFAVPLSSMGAAPKDIHRLAWWHPLYLFNKAENVNRSIATLAGYMRAARESGVAPVSVSEGRWLDVIRAARAKGTHEELILAGRELSDRVNFVYSVEDLPTLLSGPTGQFLGQFKPFLVNEMQFISELRGAELGRFLVNLSAMGGVGALLSLPGLNLADVLVGERRGERASETVKRRLPRIGRGIFGALGFDAEQSLALNSIMAGRQFAGDVGAFNEIVDLSLGPGGKDALALGTFLAAGVERLVTGEEGLDQRTRVRLARQLLPVAARRGLDAMRIARDKVVVQPTTGTPVFTPSNVTKEVALTLGGFRSIERSEREREVFTNLRVSKQLAERRSSAVRRILEAEKAGDRRKALEIRREARAKGIPITNTMLSRARAEQGKTTLEKAQERLPRRARRGIEERFRSRLPTLRQ